MPMLTAIQQIAINAKDIGRATAFYRDRLGLKHLFDAPPLMSFFDCGGIRLMLSLPTEPAVDHPSSILYFRVEDIEAAHAELSAKGVAFRDKPHLIARLPGREVWLTHFDDSEGNLLAITGEKAA